MTDLHKSIKSGLVWGSGVTVLNALIQLVVLAVLARFLTPSDFGLVGLGNIVTAFSMLVLEMGVAAAVTQRETINDEHKGSAHFIAMVMSVAVGATIIIFSAQLADYFNASELQKLLPVYAAIFMVRGIGVVPQGLVLRALSFKKLNLIEFASYLFGYGMIGVVLALSGLGVWSLVFAYLAQSIIKTVLLNLSMVSKKNWQLSKSGITGIMSFGFGDTVGQTANFFANQLDNILIGKLLGVSALGVYGRAYQISVMPVNLIGGVMQKTLFPAFAKARGDALKYIVIPWFRLALFTGLYISLSVAAWAEEVIGIVLGGQWVEYSSIFKILSYGILFRLMMKFSDSLLRSQRMLYRRAFVQILYALAVLVSVLATYEQGIQAACTAIFIVLVLASILNFVFACGAASLTAKDVIKAFTAPLVALLIFIIAYAGTNLIDFESPVVRLMLFALLSLTLIGFYSFIVQKHTVASVRYV